MRKRAVTLVAVAFTLLNFGCANYDSYRSPWQNLMYPSRPRTYYYSSRPRHHSHYRVVHNRETVPESPVTAARTGGEPATDHTAAVTPTAPTGTLSMAGDGGDRTRAKRLLDAVDSKLTRVHTGSLSAPQKETYDRASQLARRAHRALADDDAAAASSLATKASSLASDINGP
jgi:hypothetical protein